ncbi:unnamed protein product, partial [Musa banksii]
STGDQEDPWLRAVVSIALGRCSALPSPQSGRLDVIICVKGLRVRAAPARTKHQIFVVVYNAYPFRIFIVSQWRCR